MDPLAPSPARLLSVFDRLEARRLNDPAQERQALLEKAMDINTHQQLAYSPEQVADAVDEELALRPETLGAFDFGWARPTSREAWEAQTCPKGWKRALRIPYDALAAGAEDLWLMLPVVTIAHTAFWGGVLGLASWVVTGFAHHLGLEACVLGGGVLTLAHVMAGVVLETRAHPLEASNDLADPTAQAQLIAGVQATPAAERYLLHCLASGVPVLNGDMDRLIHLVAMGSLGQAEPAPASPGTVSDQLLSRLTKPVPPGP